MFRRRKSCREEGGVYVSLRPMAVVSRFLGVFPMAGVHRKNGRQLSRIPYLKRIGKYLVVLHPTHLWDIALGLTLIVNICSIILHKAQFPSNELNLHDDHRPVERKEHSRVIYSTSDLNFPKESHGVVRKVNRSGRKRLEMPNLDKLQFSNFSLENPFSTGPPGSFLREIPKNRVNILRKLLLLSSKPTGWANGKYRKPSSNKLMDYNLSPITELVNVSQSSQTNDSLVMQNKTKNITRITSVVSRKLSINSINLGMPGIVTRFGETYERRRFSPLNGGHNFEKNIVTGFPFASIKRDIPDMWLGSSSGLERVSSSPNTTHKKTTKLIRNATMGFTAMGVICQILLFVVARINAGKSSCLIALMEDLSDALRFLEIKSIAKRNKSRNHISKNQRSSMYITRDKMHIPRDVIEEEVSNNLMNKNRNCKSHISAKISPASFSARDSPLASKNQVNLEQCQTKENLHLTKVGKEKDYFLHPAPKIAPDSFSGGNIITISGRKVKRQEALRGSQKFRYSGRQRVDDRKEDNRIFWNEISRSYSITKKLFPIFSKDDYRIGPRTQKMIRKEEKSEFLCYRGRRYSLHLFPAVSIFGYVILLSWLLIFYSRFFIIGDPPFPPFQKDSATAIPSKDHELQSVVRPQTHSSTLRDVIAVIDRDNGEHAFETDREAARYDEHRSNPESHLTNRINMTGPRVITFRNQIEKLENGGTNVRDSFYQKNTEEIIIDPAQKPMHRIQVNKSSILKHPIHCRFQVFLWITSASITSSYFYLHIVQVLFFLLEASALIERVNFLITDELEQYIGMSINTVESSNQRKEIGSHLTGKPRGSRLKINGRTLLHSRLETLRLLRSAICSLIMGMESRQVVNAHRRGINIKKKKNFQRNAFTPVFGNKNYRRGSFADTSRISFKKQAGLTTALESPAHRTMACKVKDKFKALMYLKQILRAGMPRSWAKPNKIRKSLDLEPTRNESRRHAYLSPRSDYMTRIRIFTSKKKEVFGFRKENSVLPMLSTVPEKSGKCEQNENFREIAIKYGWLKGLRSKIVAKWRKKCEIPNSCNSHSTVRMTSKIYTSQMYESSMEVSRDVMNQQMIHKPDLQTLYNQKRCWKKKNDVNVIDLTKKSKYFTQPCPCGNLFSCGRVLGINGCQGTIILFLTMKSLVDVLLAFTVSISRGYMSGWQIPLQLFRIIGMATVALTATSLSEKARAGIWTMNAVCLEDLDDKSARQLSQLIIQLTASPVEVTASGYFSLTKGFLISIMSVIATYVIIIIQFKLSEA